MNSWRGAARVTVAAIVTLGITVGHLPKANGAAVLPMSRFAADVVGTNSVAVDGGAGRVFVTNMDRDSVSVHDATTGATIRTVTVGPSPRGVAVNARTGRVFIADWGRMPGDQGRVSVLDEATDTVLRTVTVGENPMAVTVDEMTGRVFVTNNDSVSVLDARSGTVLHSVSERGLAFAPIAVDERVGHAFAVRFETTPSGKPALGANYVSTLDAASGALLRRVPDMHGPLAVTVDERIGQAFSANMDGTMSIFDVRTGALVRTVPVAPADTFLNAIAADGQIGRVFAAGYQYATFSGRISVLDAGSGARLRVVAGDAAGFAVVVSERTDRVFALLGDGVTMLDAHSGRVLRTLKMVAGAMAIDVRSGRAFVSDGNGRVSILDARSGVLLHTTVLTKTASL